MIATLTAPALRLPSWRDIVRFLDHLHHGPGGHLLRTGASGNLARACAGTPSAPPCAMDCSGLASSYTVDTSAIADDLCNCAPSTLPPWDGVLTRIGSCLWGSPEGGSSLAGKTFADAQLVLYNPDPSGNSQPCLWVLCVRCCVDLGPPLHLCGFQEIWTGVKTTSLTPAGSYARADGSVVGNEACQALCTDGTNYNPPAALTVS